MVNISVALPLQHIADIRELLTCVLSPLVSLPGLIAGCLSFQGTETEPIQQICEVWNEQVAFDPEVFSQAAFPPSQSLPFRPTEPLTIAPTTHHPAQFLYTFHLSPTLPTERLQILADHCLTLAEERQLIVLAQAIAGNLRLWQEQNRHQAKVSLLEEVLGSVEHQVRQSLGLVSLYLSLLEGQPLNEQGKAVTDNLRTTVTEIVERLTTILGASEQETVALAAVDVQALVSDRAQAFAPLLQEKHLVLHVPEEAVWLLIEPHQLGQVIDNLLCNAIAFSPPHGLIEWTWDAFDGEVLLQIGDQGPGIPPGATLEIFQPGYTQRPDGHGYGLTIVQKIVRDRGGRIWVNNRPQGGAQFSIIFPQNPPLQSVPNPS